MCLWTLRLRPIRSFEVKTICSQINSVSSDGLTIEVNKSLNKALEVGVEDQDLTTMVYTI